MDILPPPPPPEGCPSLGHTWTPRLEPGAREAVPGAPPRPQWPALGLTLPVLAPTLQDSPLGSKGSLVPCETQSFHERSCDH